MSEQVLKPVPDDTTVGMPGITVPLPQQQVPKVKGPPLTEAQVKAVLEDGPEAAIAPPPAVEKPTRRQKRAAKAASLGISVKELKAAKKAGKIPESPNRGEPAPQAASGGGEGNIVEGHLSQAQVIKGVPIKKNPAAVAAATGKPSSKALKTYDRLISEILEEVDAVPNYGDRLVALRETGPVTALNDVLMLAFNDNIISQLPETIPPYRPADSKTHPANFRTEAGKMLKYFVNSPEGRGVKPHRREQLYIQMLEGIHPKDAAMIATIFAGIWPYPNIDKNMVMAAKPGLFPS